MLHPLDQRRASIMETPLKSSIAMVYSFQSISLLFIDAAKPVDQPLEWAQHRIEKCLFAGEHPRHKNARWFRHRKDDQQEKPDLKPAVRMSCQNLSGHNRAATKYTPIRTQIPRRNVPKHFPRSLLQPVASPDVCDGHNKKSDGAK